MDLVVGVDVQVVQNVSVCLRHHFAASAVCLATRISVLFYFEGVEREFESRDDFSHLLDAAARAFQLYVAYVNDQLDHVMLVAVDGLNHVLLLPREGVGVDALEHAIVLPALQLEHAAHFEVG